MLPGNSPPDARCPDEGLSGIAQSEQDGGSPRGLGAGTGTGTGTFFSASLSREEVIALVISCRLSCGIYRMLTDPGQFP